MADLPDRRKDGRMMMTRRNAAHDYAAHSSEEPVRQGNVDQQELASPQPGIPAVERQVPPRQSPQTHDVPGSGPLPFFDLDVAVKSLVARRKKEQTVPPKEPTSLAEVIVEELKSYDHFILQVKLTVECKGFAIVSGPANPGAMAPGQQILMEILGPDQPAHGSLDTSLKSQDGHCFPKAKAFCDGIFVDRFWFIVCPDNDSRALNPPPPSSSLSLKSDWMRVHGQWNVDKGDLHLVEFWSRLNRNTVGLAAFSWRHIDAPGSRSLKRSRSGWDSGDFGDHGEPKRHRQETEDQQHQHWKPIKWANPVPPSPPPPPPPPPPPQPESEALEDYPFPAQSDDPSLVAGMPSMVAGSGTQFIPHQDWIPNNNGLLAPLEGLGLHLARGAQAPVPEAQMSFEAPQGSDCGSVSFLPGAAPSLLGDSPQESWNPWAADIPSPSYTISSGHNSAYGFPPTPSSTVSDYFYGAGSSPYSEHMLPASFAASPVMPTEAPLVPMDGYMSQLPSPGQSPYQAPSLPPQAPTLRRAWLASDLEHSMRMGMLIDTNALQQTYDDNTTAAMMGFPLANIDPALLAPPPPPLVAPRPQHVIPDSSWLQIPDANLLSWRESKNVESVSSSVARLQAMAVAGQVLSTLEKREGQVE